ncbi:Protein Shroom3, partial [Oryzias melastigma]
ASVSSRSRPCSAVQLRIKSRRSEPASRPHSWHSAKLSECQQEMEHRAMDTMSGAWPQSYHASASTTDLSGGFDSGEGYLRKSPDQYSSRGSMESLDPPQSSQFHSVAQRQHPLELHGHSASHPAYSSCQQLSSARSSSSIDHLHSKRDSAYSSFSTSSSIPEYLASTPSFSPERCYSLETVPQRGGGSAEMLQTEARGVRSGYDGQQGLCKENELCSGSASTLGSSSSRAGLKSGLGREAGVCYRGNSSSTSGNNSGGIPASNRHSVGPIWGPTVNHSSYESLKGAPAPPRRSDSFAAIRNHERPNSWSSLENARSLRSLQKGSWHHSSGPVAPVSAKGSYGMEGQLHTVIEKSPESSPTTKPRQGGGFLQPPSPTRPSASPTPPSARTVLPTSVLPAAQLEPHYAQMPGSGLCGVYSGSTSRQQFQEFQSAGAADERPTETWSNERMSADNGHAPVAFPHPPHPPSASAQLRTQPLEANRHQQLDSNSGSCRPNRNSSGPEPQSLNGLQVVDSWGPHSQSSTEGLQQEQNPDVSITQVLSDHFTLENKNHHVLGYSWGDQNRPVEQSSTQPDPVSSPRLAQGQVPPSQVSKQPQPLAAPPSSSLQPPSRHFSDSAAPQYHHWDHPELDRDSEHPLTRLEIALAEVQRCASPDGPFSGSNHDNSISSDDMQGPAHSLSVLEKVSRFERRECGGRQRSLSTNVCLNRAAQLRTPEKGRSSPCGADDIRTMLERSTKGTKAHRTMSYRGGSSDYMKSRTPADPMSALQRSRSSFQLDASMETETNRDFPWRQDIQETKDASSNRSSRDVLKDAHTAVLWNTSMKQRNLSSSLYPSAAPPSVSSSSSQPASVPAKYPSLEKRGPKTMPKPQGVVITPQSPPPLTSPHTPKERHVVNPDVRGPSPPALPRVPPVGPPALLRICGRKRLTADQKKRSFSEPENMNEVGVSDSETAGLFRRGGDSWLPETSVADRRKMFELAARPGGSKSFQSAPSRTDLRQVQQDALAEYVERKRGARRGAEGQRSGPRPHSVYLQPDYSGHTDTVSLSSASSLLSLQDPGPDPNFPSGERGLCSSLPPGADLRGFQSNFFYPGRVTSPRPPAQPPTSASSDSTLDLSSEGGVSGPSHFQSRDPTHGRHRQTAEPQSGLEHSRQLNGALERAGPSRRPGKSASAEDLLERLENKHSAPQHHRSRSSPATETLTQSFPQEGVRMFGVSFSESGRCPLAADRPADIFAPEQLPSRQTARSSENLLQPVGPSQDASHAPATRREPPRNTERPRAQSASMLAASVGLPCPFSPAGVQDTGGPEWRASERLNRANLEAISFPDIPQSSRSVGSSSEALQAERQTRHSLSDAVVLEETTKDVYRSRAFSLDTRGTHPAQDPRRALPHSQIFTDRNPSRSTASPPPCSPHRHLSSLRISESSLCSPVSQQPLETSSGSLKADLDEVFLQNPPPPPSSFTTSFSGH